jgi:predicted acyltransferase
MEVKQDSPAIGWLLHGIQLNGLFLPDPKYVCITVSQSIDKVLYPKSHQLSAEGSFQHDKRPSFHIAVQAKTSAAFLTGRETLALLL